MKILKDQGKFDILTSPQDVIQTIAKAARTCYQSQDKSNPDSDEKLVRNLMARGHDAMLEFAHMNVQFSDVSRGFTHEMVRHRLCSFAQESTRYVDESDLHVVVPPHKEYEINGIEDALGYAEKYYQHLRKKGWKPEDARQALPIATRSQIVVGANIRGWKWIFQKRCDKFAHWEIRAVMLRLLKWCKENIPIVFDDFHFFTTDDGKEYAQKVMPKNVLQTEIKQFMIAYPERQEELISYIEGL